MNRFSLLLQHGLEEDTSFGVSVSCLSRLCVLKTSPPKDHVNSNDNQRKGGGEWGQLTPALGDQSESKASNV